MGTDLGALRGTHSTHNSRRGRLAIVLLIAGVVVTVAAVWFWIAVEERTGGVSTTGGDPLLLPSAVVGLGLGLLLMGGLLGWWYLSRKGEVFRLYENGLEYTRSGQSRTMTWGEINTVIVHPGKDNAVARWAGGDVSCVIKPAEGKNVTITGLTENARQLVEEVRTAHDRAR